MASNQECCRVSPIWAWQIRWTTHGVAHIRGGTWGDLGFGQGYACARDHLPTIADQIVKVRSERARFHGAGPDGGVDHARGRDGVPADRLGSAARGGADSSPSTNRLQSGSASRNRRP